MPLGAHAADITEAEFCSAVQALYPLWNEYFLAERARIMVLQAERVDIDINGLTVQFRMVGLSEPAREMMTEFGVAA